MNSKGYDQKEDLNPLHRQISGQNSSGSMCQNSTVENSTASSGYGTASKINVHCICAFSFGMLSSLPMIICIEIAWAVQSQFYMYIKRHI